MGELTLLDAFHPLVRSWFLERVGQPTEAQARAWPRIAAGDHVLVTAPTGSGKTLTAFLWALDQLLTGAWEAGQVRVLYISPLRALNNDIHRNLERPLAELQERFKKAGEPLPAIRSATRSGDTPSDERRKMLRHPPEILITTPESLNVLLTSRSGRQLLTGLETVILDEIHAVAASKRGTHLITAVERLVPLSGEFQRLALSATIRPLEVMADFVGGYELVEHADDGGEPTYRKRTVVTVRSTAQKTYAIKVRCPVEGHLEGDALWLAMVEDFKKSIHGNRSTLLFANSRRLVEKTARLINADEREDLAYSHHGSLSREVRTVVEERLKRGELKAIVATNSLELGIDVGALDEVLLIQTPRSVASAVQRVGRAGHGVGEVSRGVLYPTHGRDFLDAAVVARAIAEQDIEEIKPIELALDVLAQVILSMTVAEVWRLDDLYAQLRLSWPYHRLSRRQFELVLDMLTGRYADSRIRELRPRVTIDRVAGTVRARPGVARLLYMAGGTIPDRGYFSLRLEDSMAKLGELDEEFVWERSLGDTFTLGTQTWQVRKITHNEVIVASARGPGALAPFWRADAQDRGFFLSRKIGDFLARADERLDDPEFAAGLEHDHALDPGAAVALLDHLRQQKAATGGRLPHRRHLLVEHLSSPLKRASKRQMIFHTFWGGTVNRPLAMALQAAWEERFDEPLEVFHDDDCLLVRLSREIDAHELLALVVPEHIESLLRRKLEGSGFFGSRFRANASTALLLPRAGFSRRTPLWLSRQRAKKLGETVAGYGDFPILIETWRTCLDDEFDLDNLRAVLGEVASGEIELSEVTTSAPSPFAAGLMWLQTNTLMYEDDSPEVNRVSNLRQDVLQELVFSSRLRPRLPAALLERFRSKVQRLTPGYTPTTADELGEWIGERMLIPEEEWRELTSSVERDVGDGEVASALIRSLADTVLWARLPDAEVDAVCTVEQLAVLTRRLDLDADALVLGSLLAPEEPPSSEAHRRLGLLVAARPPSTGEEAEHGERVAEVVGEWLRFQGAVEPGTLRRVFGLDETLLSQVLGLLADSQRVVLDELRRGSTKREICDSENLEILLRWLRLESRPNFETLPAHDLPLFLAVHQGLAERGDGIEALQHILEQLFGYSLPAASWEADILPARLSPYYPSWLDSLMQESELVWFGCGKGRLSFAFPGDLELFRELAEAGEEPADDEGDESVDEDATETTSTIASRLFPRASGGFTLNELADHADLSLAQTSDELWRLAWAGEVTNDTFLTVRKGIENRFQPLELGRVDRQRNRRRGGRSARMARNRWQAQRPFFGHWRLLPASGESVDALDREELNKDRIRVLLDRYGVLFRELVARELPLLRWSRLFRTLRLMELSGEILAGRFFAGISGLQFISPSAYRRLVKGLPEDAVYGLCAIDPASLCGVDVEGLKGELPARKATTHLVFRGTQVIMTAERNGRRLELRVAPEDPGFVACCDYLKGLLSREFQPLKCLEVETINDEPAGSSAYGEFLGQVFNLTREPGGIKLWKKY